MEYVRNDLISMHFENATDVYSEIDNIHLLKNQSNIRYLNELVGRTYEPYYAKEWFGLGSMSMKECLKNAVEGNPILYRELEKMMSMINTKIDVYDNYNTTTVIKRKKVRREFGNELDIHKVYQGKLDTAWTTTQRVEVDQEHHLVTILIDIGGNCNIDAMNALWTAAACLKFIEVLEKAGKQIQVIVGGAANKVTSRYNMTASIVVKKYQEHLNVERLAAMCHIGYYRTACFAAKLISTETCLSGLGQNCDFSLDDRFFKLPIPLHDEYKSGKTKIVLFRKALDFNGALLSINEAQKNLANNSIKQFTSPESGFKILSYPDQQ